MAEIRLKAPKGAAKKKRIRGRGQGSGRGVRCGRGDKGQNARSGGGVRPGFEGGQMPLYRRIARRGFSNSPFKKEYAIVNVGQLENKYVNGDVVNNESLIEKGLIRKKRLGVKILGEGDISKKLKIDVAAMIPEDDEILRADLEQTPLTELPDSSAAVRAVDGLMAKVLEVN